MSSINSIIDNISKYDKNLGQSFNSELNGLPIFFKNFSLFGNHPGAVSLKSGIYIHNNTAEVKNIFYLMFILLHEIGHFKRYDSINYDIVSLTKLPINEYLKYAEIEENSANEFAINKLKQLYSQISDPTNIQKDYNEFMNMFSSNLNIFNPKLYIGVYQIIKSNIEKYNGNGDQLVLDILSGKISMYENKTKMNKEDIVRKKIAETIKNFFEAPEIEPAQPKIKPDVKPTPTPARPNPRRILKPLIHPGAKPAPKAKSLGEIKKKNKLKEIYFNFLKLAEKKFLYEAPMDYLDNKHGGPNPDIKKNIETRGSNPFSKIDVLHKDAENNKKSLERLGDEEYKDVVDTAKKYKTDTDDYILILNKIQKVIQLQQKHKANLEQLAKDVVQQYFGIPDDVMAEIFVELKNDFNEIDFELDDDENEEELINDFTPEEQEIIKQNVDKRIISNALMMGAGFRAHNLLEKVKPALDAINPLLFDFYVEIMSGHAFALWKIKPAEEDQIQFKKKMNDEGEIKKIIQNLKIGGKSELILGEDENGDGIREVQGAKAQAIIFPVLLHEVVKAVIEYIFANGLPQYTEHVNREIMKQSEKFHFEHWHKLLGPRLWKYLHDAIDYIVQGRNQDYTIVAYLLQEISMLPPNKFLRLIDLLIHDGAKGIVWLEKMLDRVENDLQNVDIDEEPIPQADFGNIQNLMGQIQNMLNQPGAEPQPEPVQQKPFNQMNIEELQNFILDSINSGDFDKAAEARDELEKRGG